MNEMAIIRKTITPQKRSQPLKFLKKSPPEKEARRKKTVRPVGTKEACRTTGFCLRKESHPQNNKGANVMQNPHAIDRQILKKPARSFFRRKA